MKKPESMASLIAKAQKAASNNSCIETFGEGKEKEKVFNYFRFTAYCENLASSTNSEGCGPAIRDIVMENIDPHFNRNQPYKFRGFDIIDP